MKKGEPKGPPLLTGKLCNEATALLEEAAHQAAPDAAAA